jgi:hypothetical protein
MLTATPGGSYGTRTAMPVIARRARCARWTRSPDYRIASEANDVT